MGMSFFLGNRGFFMVEFGIFIGGIWVNVFFVSVCREVFGVEW